MSGLEAQREGGESVGGEVKDTTAVEKAQKRLRGVLKVFFGIILNI